jgi:hypothetical protein
MDMHINIRSNFVCFAGLLAVLVGCKFNLVKYRIVSSTQQVSTSNNRSGFRIKLSTKAIRRLIREV